MSDKFSLYKRSLTNWQDYSAQYVGYVEPTWQELDLLWEQTFCIEEIPAGDNWGNFSSNFHLWLEERFLEWGNIKEATEHYMSFNPHLNFDPTAIFNTINCKQYIYNFIKIPPGRLIPWHCDTYAYFVKRFDLDADIVPTVKRAVVCMTDWSFGQTIQIGDSVLSHWQAGDIYSWDHEAWHGAANFGNEPLTLMQVTYND
ncbi:hypothetical protein UFOVP112_35 [uncultured Caudovirales phage]|uniref:Uncharacterized protein n=1 Tax=uncultured Caudovirales phage TaxID=2100421 RepID=A0A6J5L5E7_9CAUD|nr:hypothetical protein UFOVP112_35 [uncultured Caudovirales phage]